MDSIIVISVNDKVKVDRQGNHDLQRTMRWLMEGDGCVCHQVVHWVVLGTPLTISVVNGQEWQLRFVRHEGPGHTTYHSGQPLRSVEIYRLRVSGI